MSSNIFQNKQLYHNHYPFMFLCIKISIGNHKHKDYINTIITDCSTIIKIRKVVNNAILAIKN